MSKRDIDKRPSALAQALTQAFEQRGVRIQSAPKVGSIPVDKIQRAVNSVSNKHES